LATPIVLLPYGFKIGGHFTGADGSSISGSTRRDFNVFFAMTRNDNAHVEWIFVDKGGYQW